MLRCGSGLTALRPAYETRGRKRRFRVGWRMGFRRRRLVLLARRGRPADARGVRRNRRLFAGLSSSYIVIPLALALGLLLAIPLSARTKDKLSYGEGLIINIPLPEAEVQQVVEE